MNHLAQIRIALLFSFVIFAMPFFQQCSFQKIEVTEVTTLTKTFKTINTQETANAYELGFVGFRTIQMKDFTYIQNYIRLLLTIIITLTFIMLGISFTSKIKLLQKIIIVAIIFDIAWFTIVLISGNDFKQIKYGFYLLLAQHLYLFWVNKKIPSFLNQPSLKEN